MKTEAKLKEALKNYMTSKPLEEINVTMLCKKCDIHRQTFYYHYQDIYDLLSTILLNENVKGLNEAKTPVEILNAFVDYTAKNFKFLQATYTSSAKDLIDQLYSVRIYNKLLIILANSHKDLNRNDCRVIARRFSKYLSEEFAHCFTYKEMTQLKLDRYMRRFGYTAIETILPAVIDSYKKEKARKN